MSQDTEVVVDLHEPMNVYREFDDHPDVDDVLLAPLGAADIVVNGVGFERKTWPDYVHSLTTGRLEKQAKKLRAYEVAYILVEGDMSGTESLEHTQMSGRSIRGHMASLTAREEYGVRAVVPCSSMSLLVDYAVRLGRKHEEEPVTDYLDTGSVDDDTAPAGKRMWGCLPGVGPELANRLWGRYGSPGHFVEFIGHNPDGPVEELMEVDGIGYDTAEDILAALLEGPP